MSHFIADAGTGIDRFFKRSSARTFIHSVAGCAFYGAFAAKVVFVHTKRLPGWALPVAGGLLFSILLGLWITSAAWFFSISGVAL